MHFEFESVETMQAAMASEGTAEVLSDVASYTSITPILQTSEIIDVG